MSWIVAMLMLLSVTPVSVAPVALPLPHGATDVTAPAGAATAPAGTSSAATSAITTNGNPSILAARVPTIATSPGVTSNNNSYSSLSVRVASCGCPKFGSAVDLQFRSWHGSSHDSGRGDDQRAVL